MFNVSFILLNNKYFSLPSGKYFFMGKTYLIAGASGGIGNETARILKAQGHLVINLGRTPNEICDEFVEHDFTSGQPMPDIDTPIHGLVYAPGSITLKPFASLSEQDFLTEFNLNVMGAVATIKKVAANLKRNQGSVVLFSSVAAQTGLSYHASISTSKGAIEGLTRALAAEFAPDIRVNAVAPSLTDTKLAAPLLSSDLKRQANADRHPLKRIGTPSDIARAAVFLLESDWITGQIIGVNGGMGTVLK